MEVYILAAICGWMIATVIGTIRDLRFERRKHRETLDRLESWRRAWDNTDRWLAEFPDVEAALAHLKASAEGHGGTNIMQTREAMRARGKEANRG